MFKGTPDALGNCFFFHSAGVLARSGYTRVCSSRAVAPAMSRPSGPFFIQSDDAGLAVNLYDFLPKRVPSRSSAIKGIRSGS